jgi:Uncharacterized conserved protein
MEILSIIGLSIVAIIVLVGIWAVSAYNSLVNLKAHSDEGWSGIDIQLKRRYDVVPNLVGVVQGYSIHEKEVLENVTRMRSVAMNAPTVEQELASQQGLTSALKTLFAVAENYPNLKANENFMHLQQQLSTLETDIQLSRRYYNGAARNYNVASQRFPSNIIAGFFGFGKAAYFEIGSSERENPKVKF